MLPADTCVEVEVKGKGTKRKPEQHAEGETTKPAKLAKQPEPIIKPAPGTHPWCSFPDCELPKSAHYHRTWWINCELKKGASVIQSSSVSNKGLWGYTGGGMYPGNPVRKRRKQDQDEAIHFISGTNNVWIRIKEPEVKGMVINVEVFENENPGKAQYQPKHGDFLVRDIQFSKHPNLEAAKLAGESYFFPAHWTRHLFHVCV